MARDMTNARNRLFKSRGHQCEVCGYDGLLDCHHITPVSEGGKNNDDNLILLCEKCHADAHGHNKKHWLDQRRATWKA